MLPLNRYRFTARLSTPLQLPPQPGSRLRGALGFALKHSACQRPGPVEQAECSRCPQRLECGYTRLFEPRQAQASAPQRGTVPVPLLLEPAGGGGSFEPGQLISFDMVVFGQACAQLPLLTTAVARMLAQGLGPEKARAQLLAVCLPELPDAPRVYTTDSGEFLFHQPIFPALDPDCQPQRLILNLTSPLRLQQRGKLLSPGQLTARAFITALLRRIEMLGRYHVPGWQSPPVGHLYALLDDLSLEEENCHWQEEARYSHRQARRMTMGGICGRLLLSGPLAPFLPWLVTGEYTHVGKNTVFGFGGYRIEGF